MDAELGETIIWSFFSVREIEDREKVAMRSAPDSFRCKRKRVGKAILLRLKQIVQLSWIGPITAPFRHVV